MNINIEKQNNKLIIRLPISLNGAFRKTFKSAFWDSRIQAWILNDTKSAVNRIMDFEIRARPAFDRLAKHDERLMFHKEILSLQNEISVQDEQMSLLEKRLWLLEDYPNYRAMLVGNIECGADQIAKQEKELEAVKIEMLQAIEDEILKKIRDNYSYEHIDV